MNFKIEAYNGKYDDEIIGLILSIQNDEAKINLPLDEQPDLKDIKGSYIENGGGFWLAKADGKVIGTVGLMMKENNCAVLKKFFVKAEYRSQRVGLALYKELLAYAAEKNVRHIILDTPSVAVKSHRFYEKAGFRRTEPTKLPIPYDYPDRNSFVYILDLV